MERVNGRVMPDFWEDQKDVVRKELQSHLATLKTLKSNKLGGHLAWLSPQNGSCCGQKTDRWSPRPSAHEEWVFCHNDLSQNIIVDLATLKIKAIVGWECAGFYPPQFESSTYSRLAALIPRDDEYDNSFELLKFLVTSRQGSRQYFNPTLGCLAPVEKL
ncbi:hypothetical protein VTI74DRAFT_5715 [Chaetomium olivicolor]